MKHDPLINWAQMPPKTKFWLGVAAFLSFLPFILVIAFEAVASWSEDRQVSIMFLVGLPTLFGASVLASGLRERLKSTGFAKTNPWLAKQADILLDTLPMFIFMMCAMLLNGSTVLKVVYMTALFVLLVLCVNGLASTVWARVGPYIKQMFSGRS